jgi:uncharacterized protein YggE
MVAATCGTTSTTVQNQGSENLGVSVSGSGKVTGAPDVANISLGVSVLEQTVAAARERAAASLGAMIDSMKQNGVEDKDIQTDQLSIYPEYDYRNDTQLLRGFRVQNTVNATIRNIDRTGEIVDDAVAAGGDSTTINSISFSIDNPQKLKSEAREAAVADARARAETLAEAAGVSLGKAISITETSYSPPVYYEQIASRGAADTAAGALPPTPIEAGELDVVVDVSVTWAIE